MSKSLTADMPAEEAEIKAAIEEMLAEVERNREKMRHDREEIDRLKTRTRAMLAQLEAA
jgi:polyhydroxyalkanoate synthesis regulator phasin